MRKSGYRFGPGFLVAAAFIGPGTITTATMAGARFEYSLLWAVAFSVAATLVLQEMSARLGLVTRMGLGEVLRTTFAHPISRVVAPLLVLAAIVFGNGAFEMGNLLGAAMGAEALTGCSPRVGAVLTATLAAILLFLGSYSAVEKLLTCLVGLMGAAFIVTAIMIGPDIRHLLSGLLWPSLPPHSVLTVVALIGTTVVPYNLFLHASAVQQRWSEELPLRTALRESRWDTGLSIGFGGCITVAAIVTAAGLHGDAAAIESASDMARQLRPLLGPGAHACFAIGLLSAGLTSAITAPLAAAYAASGILGWQAGLKSWRFRAIWGGVIMTGSICAWFGHRPISAIIFAQAANGILLPWIAVVLLIVMNRKDLLGAHVNGTAANLLGMTVVLVSTGLSVFQLLRLAGWIGSG